ncbi:MAG: hypothetical protein ACI9R3_000955 [Verrucomicrobiales bacterium]|jgi:hypothetical protein
MKSAGAQIVFRSTELGEVKRDDCSRPTFHVHAHTIIHLIKKLNKARWSELLRAVRSSWKTHFSDSQRIHQAREACNYVVKPMDLDQLVGKELVELHYQLFRLHLVQCLGALKEQRKSIEESEKRRVFQFNGTCSRWETIDNWDYKRTRKTQLDPSVEENELIHESPVEDWIVSTLPPSFALSKRSEPLAVVLNYTGNRIEQNSFRAERQQDALGCGPGKAAASVCTDEQAHLSSHHCRNCPEGTRPKWIDNETAFW